MAGRQAGLADVSSLCRHRLLEMMRVMDDVLSHGRDREPSRRAGRLAVVVVLAVLAVVIAWHLPRGRPAPPHRAAAAAVAAGPVQLAGLGSGAAGLLDGARREHRAGHARAGRRRLPATASLATIYTFSRPRP
jgi:hypothetical protein